MQEHLHRLEDARAELGRVRTRYTLEDLQRDRLLTRGRYLDRKLAQKLQKMVGLRNFLVHEYVAIDVERLYKYLD